MAGGQACTTVPAWAIQRVGTCWFNALLMALFYSDGARGVLLSKVPQWRSLGQAHPQTRALFQLFEDMVTRHKKFDLRRRPKSTWQEIKELFKKHPFEQVYPERILKLLHALDDPTLADLGVSFQLNREYLPKRDNNWGFWSELYMPFLLQVLGINFPDVVFLYTLPGGTFVAPRVTASKEGRWQPRPGRTPAEVAKAVPKLLVVSKRAKDIGGSYPLSAQPFETRDEVTFNGHLYKLDGVLLVNGNKLKCRLGHQIAGVTCNGARYVYNGWARATIDPALWNRPGIATDLPCDLMPHDWNSPSDSFCLNPYACKLDFHGQSSLETDVDMCFNFADSSADFIYVLQGPAPPGPASPAPAPAPAPPAPAPTPRPPAPRPPLPAWPCPEGQIRNPATGRCVAIDGKIGRKLRQQQLAQPKPNPVPSPKRKPPSPKPAPAPPSPKPPSPKPAPSPKPKPKPRPHQRDCPDGKVMNPATGRCVKADGRVGRKVKA